MPLGTWAAAIPISGVGSSFEVMPHGIDCQPHRLTFGRRCCIMLTSTPAEEANSGCGVIDVGGGLLPTSEPRVEQISQGVAEHIEAEHCGAQGHPWPDG